MTRLDESNFCNGTVTPGTDGICLIYTKNGIVEPFPQELATMIMKGAKK